jgi:hypothetical protein
VSPENNGQRPGVAILGGRVDALERDLATVRQAVTDLTEAINALAVQAARSRPIHWPDLAGDEHAARHAELLAWMREVLVERYPMDAEALTPCWWQHPTAVDLLTATWQSWMGVYRNPAASVTSQVAWQHVTLPTTSARLRVVLGNCARQHVDDPHQPELVTGGWG